MNYCNTKASDLLPEGAVHARPGARAKLLMDAAEKIMAERRHVDPDVSPPGFLIELDQRQGPGR